MNPDLLWLVVLALSVFAGILSGVPVLLAIAGAANPCGLIFNTLSQTDLA